MAAPTSIADLSTHDKLSLHLQATPAGFYVTTSDTLSLSVIASVATTLTASGQVLTVDGEVRPFTLSVVATTNRVVASTSTPIADGWLLNVTVQPSSGSPITGQAFARLQIVRGGGAGAFVIATLTSGYVTAQQPIVWPFGQVKGSTVDAGAIRSITGTDPAAGVEISETVPAGARWRVLAIRVTLITDATVINREPSLVLDDGTNIFSRMPIGTTMPASNTLPMTFARQSLRASASVSGDHNVPLAENVLPAGARVRTITANLQAGDNWGAPQLLVEEWLEGA